MSPEPVQKAVEAITENGTSELVVNGENCSSPEENLESNLEPPEVNQTESADNHKTGEVHTV